MGAGGEVMSRQELAAAMSRYAGVLRDADGLDVLVSLTGGAGAAGGEAGGSVLGAGDGDLDLGAVEAASLRTVSALIAAGARRRAESRGCHRRRDATQTDERPWHTLVRWDGRELVVTKEEM